MTWLLPYDDLTQEQKRAVELNPQEHRVIFGAPGSGKTQILLHRAAHLRKQWNVDPQRLHIFVFTNVLESYIQSALDVLEIPRSCVSTLDAWCVQYHRQYI